MNFSQQLKGFDMILCHGGSGIVQQCIYNKIPILIMAHMCDQFYWLDYVFKNGIGGGIKATDGI